MSMGLKHSIACSVLAFLGTVTLVNPSTRAAVGGGASPATADGYDDHRHMMDQLGIRALRPGESGQNQERFTEEKANPYHNTMPDVLTMKDGNRAVSYTHLTLPTINSG